MRAIEIGAALVLSAGAFGGLVGATAVSTTAPAVEAASIEPEPEVLEAAPAPAALAPEVAEPRPEATPTEVTPEPAPEPEPDGIAVPDFEGMSGLEAWQAGRRLGIRVHVRDPNGDRVERWGARDVTIDDRQSPAPGTRVEAGALVRLRSDWDPRRMIASGY